MRIIKGIKVILFVILFILMNLLLSYFLVKANGPSEVMWKDFRKTEKIDTVYLGSSFSQMTFNPYIIDENTGWNSFNMGTPGQPLDQTKEALKTYKKSGTDLRNPISGADAECKCKSYFRKSKKLWVLIVGKTETGLELCNKQ